MVGKYEVTLDGQAVGTAELSREGLYYRIRCRCRLKENQLYRLYADGEKVGVLAPENGEWTLITKVSAKRLRQGCVFSLDENREQFFPFRPGEVFDHLDKLRRGHLGFREGEPGLILK